MKWIVGVDEVGRGPLAGPVCVCAAAMPLPLYKKMRWEKAGALLTDSKKMKALARERWYREAKSRESTGSVRIGVSMQGAGAIDRQGISACIAACIKSALSQLALDPRDCTVLLDGGLKAPAEYADQETVVRGDSAHKIISLASVIAKVARDRYMVRLHKKHPAYAWEKNKGYGTKAHLAALRLKGPTAIHRKSFISKVFL